MERITGRERMRLQTVMAGLDIDHVRDATEIMSQLRHGPLGWVAGRIMATRDTNVERNRWMVDQLAPAPDARILEIGHGPGLAIEQLWGGIDGGQITGVDMSALMSRTAARRNRDGVAAGVVHFEVADSSALPDSLRDFDLIFGVNA